MTDKKLVGIMAGLVDPKSRYIDDGPAIHRLLRCTIDFVTGSSDADIVAKADIIKGFEDTVIPHLKEDGIVRAVLAFCDNP